MSATEVEALALAAVGLSMALYYGTALLVVVADLRLAPWVNEVMGGHPPYRGMRRWVHVGWVGPMTLLGIWLLFAPLFGVSEPDSALAWTILLAAWAIFLGAIALAVRRLLFV